MRRQYTLVMTTQRLSLSPVGRSSGPGQLPLGSSRASGQTITPVYEGWSFRSGGSTSSSRFARPMTMTGSRSAP